MLEERVDAQLILENGMRFDGKAFGHIGEAAGEVIFTTGMTGYQEVITDPSYAGQIVVMTYPLVGNAGINLEDMESDSVRIRGVVVREKCDEPSNWRCEMSLDGFLKQHKIMGLEGVDTRAITRALRESGAMKGMVTTDMSAELAKTSEKVDISTLTCAEKYTIHGDGPHIAVMDFGIRKSLLNELSRRENRLTVFPAFTKAEEILAENPDHILLSNGPGDPKALPEVIETIKALLPHKPIAGVCLGHLLLALAMGCDTTRMHFGHHGSNHPVRDVQTGRVWVTSQSHVYVVSTLAQDVGATFTHVNDGSIEGIRHRKWGAAGVQFYSEGTLSSLIL